MGPVQPRLRAVHVSRLVVDLRELTAAEVALAGGKGAQLGAMLHAGLPVPEGFCVSTEAFRCGMNEGVRTAIAGAYAAIGGRVAVRSSATAEDLPEASFAGQQDTFLNIEGTDAVIEAVQACWKSLFTERAVAYRRDRGMAEESVAMAVVVQRMVDPDAAGVLFTINPVSGAIDELVIEAARGLGDKVVSAQVTPDRFRVRRRAPYAVIQREGEETGTALTPALIAELAHLGLTAERVLGCAADIEWAVADGRAYLLQARAVTAAGPRTPTVHYGSRWNAEHAKERLIFWGNYNLRDTMPYPHTPFSWSFWNYLMIRPLFVSMGLIAAGDGESLDDLPAMADMVEGRMYFNMNVWAGLVPSRPRWLSVKSAELLDEELGPIWREVLASGEFEPIGRPFSLARAWRCIACAPAGVGTLLGRMSAARAWQELENCKREVANFARVEDLSILDEKQIIALARYFAMENAPRGIIPLIASGPALPATVMLQWLLRRIKREDLYLPLLSGVGRNPTVQAALAIWDLAEAAGPVVRTVFANEAIERVPEALQASEDGREFLARMNAFLALHGYRAVREYEFSCPRWRDDPTFVYESVRNYFNHPAGQPTPRQHYQRQVEEHERAKQELDRVLRYRPLRRWLCRRLIRVIEERMPLREAFKSALLLGLAHVRDLLLEVGRRQVARGALEKADDFLFLSIPEAEKIATGELDVNWIRQQIPIRRREFATYMRIDPPLVMRSDGKPVVKPAKAGEVLQGAGASPGVVRGRARIMFDPTDGARLSRGDILVAKFTDPGWTPLFLTAGGLVMEVGGIISHGAVVAREYGLPAVVGIKHATRILREGEVVEIDGGSGEVRREVAAVGVSA